MTRKTNEDYSFAVGEKVKFADYRFWFTIKAISERYAILTHPFKLQNTVIYTIIDRQKMIRGPNNLVFNPYDYSKQEDIDRCLEDLQSGACEVSRRRSIPVLLSY